MMLVEIWLALFAAGVLTSIAAFAVKKAALYASVMNLFIWLVVAVAAFDVTVVTNAGETVSVAAPAVAVLALVNAVASLPVAYAAATGTYGDDDGPTDGVTDPTGRMDADKPHPGLNRGDL